MMEEHFRAGRFKAGSIAGVEAVGRCSPGISPPRRGRTRPPASNELPDQPTLL